MRGLELEKVLGKNSFRDAKVSLPEKSVEFLAVDEAGLDSRSRLALQAGKFARSRGSGRRRGQIPI